MSHDSEESRRRRAHEKAALEGVEAAFAYPLLDDPLEKAEFYDNQRLDHLRAGRPAPIVSSIITPLNLSTGRGDLLTSLVTDLVTHPCLRL